MKPIRERDIERYLVKRVKALGGEVRKVQWVGRDKAPDRVVMLPAKNYLRISGVNVAQWPSPTIWLEVKSPDAMRAFPSNAHERAQDREHKRMRAMGQRVVVVGTFEGVDALLA